jgi:hypothetical protein
MLGESVLGDAVVPADGDPTEGGKTGQLGAAPSVTSDEPADGHEYEAGGGSAAEEADAPPVPDPGPGA